jgi:hypothetical protein
MAEWLREQNVGSKLVNLPQLNSQAVFDSTCKGKSIHNLNIGVCVITFLPHILDSGEDEREKYLETIRNVVRKFRGKPFTFVWSQGGDQYDFETIFGAEGSGYPSVIAISHGKKLFAKMRKAFDEDHLETFVNDILEGNGRFSTYSK